MLDFTTFSLLKCSISFKKDFFKFRTKFVLFRCFWAGTRKDYCTVIFYISTLKFFQTQNFVQKQKSLNPGPKLAQLGILGWNFKKIMQYLKSASSNFGLRFNKTYYQIFNQYPRICETINFDLKRKKINLGPKMLYWAFGLEFSKIIVIFVINALQSV